MPSVFLSGLSFILFENVECYDIKFYTKKRKASKDKKQIENDVLVKYLERCRKSIEESNLKDDSKEKKRKKD